MGKTEDFFYASDEELLSISKDLSDRTKKPMRNWQNESIHMRTCQIQRNHCLEFYQKMQI